MQVNFSPQKRCVVEPIWKEAIRSINVSINGQSVPDRSALIAEADYRFATIGVNFKSNSQFEHDSKL